MRMPIRPAVAMSLTVASLVSSLVPARAQDSAESFSQVTTPMKGGKLTSFNPIITGEATPTNLRDVTCEALLTKDGLPMQHGLTWRVFSPIPAADGKLPLLATSEGGSAALRVAFGGCGGGPGSGLREGGDHEGEPDHHVDDAAEFGVRAVDHPVHPVDAGLDRHPTE